MLDVEKAINGDDNAFYRIIMKNKDTMYKTAIIILKNEEDASDALQESLIKMYENIKNLQKAEAFNAWSRKIVLNNCYKIINKKKKINDINLKLIDEYITTKEDYYEWEDEALKKLEQLEPELKLTASLYYYKELTIKQISQVMKIPEGTVKSRLSRARRKLCLILKEDKN